jgi:tetratricopeptide (TPR) repeat protein
VSIRFLLVLSIAATLSAQRFEPPYDAASASPWGQIPSAADSQTGFPRSDRWHNLSSPATDEPLTPSAPPTIGRRINPETVSTDQLRHPLKGKALRKIRKAESLIAAHEFARAREVLQKAARDSAAAPYAHSLLGQEYLRVMRFPEAIVELRIAVQLLPSNVPDRANLGYALLLTGQTAAAEAELRRALELQPSNPRTHLVLGLLCYASPARLAEAQEHLEFAARELPGARLLLARFYQLTGRPEEADRAFAWYQEALGSNTDTSAARRWFENAGKAAAFH